MQWIKVHFLFVWLFFHRLFAIKSSLFLLAWNFMTLFALNTFLIRWLRLYVFYVQSSTNLNIWPRFSLIYEHREPIAFICEHKRNSSLLEDEHQYHLHTLYTLKLYNNTLFKRTCSLLQFYEEKFHTRKAKYSNKLCVGWHMCRLS